MKKTLTITVWWLNWEARCWSWRNLHWIKGVKYIQKTNSTEKLVLIKTENMILLLFKVRHIPQAINAELQKYGEQLMINKGGLLQSNPNRWNIRTCYRSFLWPFNFSRRDNKIKNYICIMILLQSLFMTEGYLLNTLLVLRLK
jgi:hypothetical protein